MGLVYEGAELPECPFHQWDLTDPEGFEEICDHMASDVTFLYPYFEKNSSAAESSVVVIKDMIIPCRIAYDQAVGLHLHRFFEIDYVMRGGASLRLEEKSISLRQGMFCFLSPNLKHDVLAEHGSQVVSITIPETLVEGTLFDLMHHESVLLDFFHTSMSTGDDNMGCMLFSVVDEQPVRFLLRELLQEFHNRVEYSDTVTAAYVQLLFAQILRQCGDSCEVHRRNSKRQGMIPMLAILKYIQSNYRTVTLGEVAERFHYEATYLGKQIKAGTGKNFTDIVRELRLEEAKQLLRTTNLRLEQVAEQAGYESQTHFSRAFRQAEGMPPGEYRKNRK